ncbi:MAG: Hsp70 family protein [Myxococcaceae bacterium]|nr:Hsp70 family protein [Myxococcaceae bacterium]
MSGPVLGIDFGTTNTAAAFVDRKNRLQVVPVTEKSHMLPSVAWFHAGGKALVGHAARTQIIDDPKHTVFGLKRFLGRRFQSDFVTRNRERFAFDVVEGEDGYCAVKMYGQLTSMTDVAALVIQRILALANTAAKEPFTECVLTVPAHASIRMREAVRHAAQKAGLTVRALVNEPTAAALYYANLRNPEQTVLVFDLGGGTFDATLLSVQNRVVKVRATGGDGFLGGADFDESIVEALVEAFEREEGVGLRGNKVVMQRLLFAAESAKMALSRAEQTEIRIPCIAQRDGRFVDFQHVLTRRHLEELTFRLVERTASACDELLERAGLTPAEVDELVLVGGQTRMPAIRRRLSHFPRLSSERGVHPELGVAVGAAILGRNLARPGSTGLSDVVPMPISVMLPGGSTHEVIPANTPVPCMRTLPLQGLPPWSAPVPLAIFQAVDATSVERDVLGTVRVGPEWRLGSGAGASLALHMGQDFALSARLVAPNGRQEKVDIVDARPQGRAVAAAR